MVQYYRLYVDAHLKLALFLLFRYFGLIWPDILAYMRHQSLVNNKLTRSELREGVDFNEAMYILMTLFLSVETTLTQCCLHHLGMKLN